MLRSDDDDGFIGDSTATTDADVDALASLIPIDDDDDDDAVVDAFWAF